MNRRDHLWVWGMAAVLLGVLLPSSTYSASIPLIKEEWGISNAEAGLIFSAFQIGYLFSVLVFLPLTDRRDTRHITVAAVVTSVLANSLFPLLASSFVSALLLRAVAGMGLGGMYMPGLRAISERVSRARRGQAVGIYVAAFVLGGAVSFAATGAMLSSLGWRNTYLVTSLSGSAVIPLICVLLCGSPPIGRRTRQPTTTARLRIGGSVWLMILGYVAHMWEMYGARSWLATFLVGVLMRAGHDLTSASAKAAGISSIMVTLGAMSTAVAGYLSDRWGRTRTVSLIMLCSMACSLLLGWLKDTALALVLVVTFFYGLVLNAESPVFSTGITELTPPDRLGVAMMMQSFTGFMIAAVSPLVFGWVLDVAGANSWGIAFSLLGLGAVLGPAAMISLRQRPESSQMAGGRK